MKTHPWGQSSSDGRHVFRAASTHNTWPRDARMHGLTRFNATLEEIEERYAERTPNAETAAALSEMPTRRIKSATQLLRSLKG